MNPYLDHDRSAPEASARALAGRTIAILQTRHQRELANLIERHGGTPYLAASLREVRTEDRAALRDSLEQVAQQPIDMAIFQTGVGTAALFDLAAELGLDGMLTQRLAGAIVVARGPKPLAVLLRRGVRIDRRTPEPHTTAEVMALVDGDLMGRTVLLQHYGARNQTLVAFLSRREASVIEVTTYHWALPEDIAPLRGFIRALADGRIDATAFTSASQVENLFHVAEVERVDDQLVAWLGERTAVAAIGPVCAQALRERGIPVHLQPRRPKMVPFVQALCEYFVGAEKG